MRLDNTLPEHMPKRRQTAEVALLLPQGSGRINSNKNTNEQYAEAIADIFQGDTATKAGGTKLHSNTSKRAQAMMNAGKAGKTGNPAVKKRKLNQFGNYKPNLNNSFAAKKGRFGNASSFRARSSWGSNNRNWKTNQKFNGKRKGFYNYGNTCYCNAVLRSLLSITTFNRELRNELFVEKCLHEKKQNIYSTFIKLILQDRAKNHGVLRCGPFKQRFNKKVPLFDNHQQQDAHEFFTEVLNTINEDLKRHLNIKDKDERKSCETLSENNKENINTENIITTKKPEFKFTCTPTKEYTNDNQLPIKNNFLTEVEHTLTCTKCEYQRKVVESFYALSLDLPETMIGRKMEMSNKKLIPSEWKPKRDACSKGHSKEHFKGPVRAVKGTIYYKCVTCETERGPKQCWGSAAIQVKPLSNNENKTEKKAGVYMIY
eukprot:UN24966